MFSGTTAALQNEVMCARISFFFFCIIFALARVRPNFPLEAGRKISTVSKRLHELEESQ